MLLPPHWAVRDKSHDYGIDQEVEIFSETGESTGAIFLVQLRATDDLAHATHANFDLDQLSYFSSLDLPTAVFRYFRGTGSFHWKWHFNIDLKSVIDGQKTIRVKFSENEKWGVEDAEHISRTVETIRNLRRFDTTHRLFLKSICTDADSSAQQKLERAIDKIVQAVPSLAHSTVAETDVVTLVLEYQRRELKLRIDRVSSVTFEGVELAENDLCARITYGLCLLLSRLRLTRHALDVVAVVIQEKFTTNSQFLAVEACLLLTGDLKASAELAVLNGVHKQHDENYARYLLFLRNTPYQETRRTEALAVFLRAAADFARSTGSATAEAAALYSLGNVYRKSGPYALAVSCYNKARKLYPAYPETDYFYAELAGCLYLCRRYRCAAAAYECARQRNPAPGLIGCLGDALLFSGRLKDARGKFEAALASENAIMSAEAALKLSLCDWLMSEYQSESVLRRPSIARFASKNFALAATLTEADFAKTLTEDPLDEWANFNLGLIEARSDNYEKAFARFLLCAFAVPNDLQSWTYAIFCALKINKAELFVSTMMCAVFSNGRDGYDSFRSHLENVGADAEILAVFDHVGRELISVNRANHDGPFEIRSIGVSSDNV